MASSSSEREARRRRIMERGADRLALITGGRINALPSPSISDVSHSPDDDKAFNPENQHRDSTIESDKTNTDDGESRAEPPLPKSDTSRDTLRISGKEEDIKVESSHVPPIIQQEYKDELRARHSRLFTPKQINSAIAATENIRICFSLMVAILVALSYIGFPMLGNTAIKSIIYYRPLYLVFITGISIVLKQLVLGGAQRSVQKRIEVASVGGYGRAEQLGKALELGLCFKNMTNAIFMDFSVYAVALVCSLAFAQKLVY